MSKWSAPADRRVVEAVLATFRDPVETSRRRVWSLKHRQWAKSYHWLDASGLAIYLLSQVEELGIEGAVASATLRRLRRNHADNSERSAVLFAEFVEINQSFQQAGVSYCNVKGFTLSPEACPDPGLRCQLDLDFLVSADHLELCRKILATRGYELRATTDSVWEFKRGSSQLAGIEDLYKPRAQGSVEIHFAGLPSDERLARAIPRVWGDHSFPVLSRGDQFIGQALHLFGHICSAHTRISWLLEYRRFVSAHSGDEALWSEVRERAWSYPDAATAIGLSSLLSARLFGGESPVCLNAWTLDCLPAAVKLWANEYGVKSLLADFPGTKFYLLLQRELKRGGGSAARVKRHSPLPVMRVPHIVYAETDDNLWKRMLGHLYRVRYFLFRLRFHTTQGLRYAFESVRFQRRLRALKNDSREPGAGTPHLRAIEDPHMDKI